MHVKDTIFNSARATAKKVLVVLTDGQATDAPIDTEAAAVQADGIIVYSIGVGDVDTNELNLIASDPDSQHVWERADFTFLQSIKSQVASQVCTGTPATIPCQSNPCLNGVCCIDSADLSTYSMFMNLD